jgi:hypothetical protein
MIQIKPFSVVSSSRTRKFGMASSTGNGILNGLVARSSSGPGNSFQNGAGLSSFSSADQARNRLVDTEFLIVGAGPAGASLACFLGSYGKSTYLMELQDKP